MACWHQILLTVLIELRYLISTTIGKKCMELPPDVQSLHFSMSFFDLEGPMHRNSALDFEIITYFKSGLYFPSRSTM